MRLGTWVVICRESTRGIFRNGLMSFASASTVAVALLTLAAVYLLAANINHLATVAESQVEIRVLLEEGLSEADVRRLEVECSRIPGVRQVTYTSKHRALELMRQKLGQDAGLLEAVEDLNPLPASLDIQVDPQRISEIVAVTSRFDGVDRVRDDQALVGRLLQLTAAIRAAGLALVLLLAGATLFIIANTVRLTVFARRNEIRIMKLVGATDAFVRWPFILEGIILGLVGAGVAATAVFYGYHWLYVQAGATLPFLPLLSPQLLIADLSQALLALGVILGAAGSAFSLHRHLQV